MQAFTAPQYSAFAKDSAIEAYVLLDQKIEPPPNINTYPEVEF